MLLDFSTPSTNVSESVAKWRSKWRSDFGGWLLVSGGAAEGKIAPAVAGLLWVAVAVVGNGVCSL